jgi:predicted ArsR family transcriptional regulator
MDRLLWYVFAGSRGGPTRIRLMRCLLDQPRNTNQLAKDLGMDYKTIDYQLRVLKKHTYAVSRTKGYGRPWEPSRNFLATLDEFEAVAHKVLPQPVLGKTPNQADGE